MVITISLRAHYIHTAYWGHMCESDKGVGESPEVNKVFKTLKKLVSDTTAEAVGFCLRHRETVVMLDGIFSHLIAKFELNIFPLTVWQVPHN